MVHCMYWARRPCGLSGCGAVAGRAAPWSGQQKGCDVDSADRSLTCLIRERKCSRIRFGQQVTADSANVAGQHVRQLSSSCRVSATKSTWLIVILLLIITATATVIVMPAAILSGISRGGGEYNHH